MIEPPSCQDVKTKDFIDKIYKIYRIGHARPNLVNPVKGIRPVAVLCVFMSLWFNALPATGQAPELSGMLPAGGLRGRVTKVRIGGKNLAGSRLYVSGTGVSVKALQVEAAGDSLTADVAVEPAAPLGPREVRITTAKGVSNGARFWVDIYPNRVLDQPMREDQPPVSLDGKTPEVINGRIAAKAGRDRFTIDAAAGDAWTFDCFADRLRSRLDPVVEIRDHHGVLVRLVQSTWENDPRFFHTFAQPGRYTLIVRDSEYNGGPNYVYRLLAGRMPFVTSFAPRGVQPGKPQQVAVQCATGVARSVQVFVPAESQGAQRSNQKIFWAEARVGDNAMALLPMLLGPEPVTCVSESDGVQPLPAIPVAMDGAFTRSSRTRFRFHAAKDAKYVFDLLGRRIGSRIDGEIRVLDSVGKEIAENDDLSVLTKDARVEFAPPAEGDFVVEVRNVEEVAGPDCYYRLKVSLIEPDFRVSIATDKLAPPIGGTIGLPVTVERIGGFSGPVDVRVEGLPAGVACTGGVIPIGKNSVELTLTSAVDAAPSTTEVRVIGSATIGGKPIVRDAPAWEQYEHRSIDLLLSVEYSYTRPHHLWDMLLCAVVDRVDPITVSTAASTFDLQSGAKLEIPVRILRHPGSASEVKIDVRNLPAKVTAAPLVIQAGQTEGKLMLTAAPDAPVDLANLIVSAKHGNSTSLAPVIHLSVATRK